MTARVCTFDKCPTKMYGKTGLCMAHYQQRRRGEELHAIERRVTHSYDGARCAFDPCERVASSRRLCKAHYDQQREGRELSILWVDVPEGPCSFDGCERAWKSHGLCHTHNEQRLKGKKLKPIRDIHPPGTWAGVACGFEGCNFQVKAKGLCATHGVQKYKGLPLKPVTRYKSASEYRSEVMLETSTT